MTLPRRLAHRGRVEAEGAWLSAALLAPSTLRARALALWAPGTRILATAAGDLVLLFPAPRPMLADRAPGEPLVRQGGLLSTAPLAEDEIEAACADPGDLARAHHGVWELLDTRALRAVDPATWIDVGDLPVATVASLGAPPQPIAAANPPLEVDLRRDLPAALREPAPDQAAAEEAFAALGARAAPSAATPGRARLASLFERLATWSRPRKATTTSTTTATSIGGASPRAPGAAAPRPAGPSLGDRLAGFFADLALRARMGSLFGARQARYFGRLLDDFERGDLDRALRHAIRLGGGGAAGRPALGLPTPRARLSLDLSGSPGGAGGAGYMVGDDLYEILRQRYRQAAERLEQEGRFEEAAFVLADLLGDSGGAVLLLERHGRLRRAAELAEARELEPALRVRLWLAAGEPERAVAVAKRHDAFAAAVMLLERKDRALAEALRLHWADALAEAGAFLEAVEAIWPLPHARALARAWLEHAVEAGGAGGARALARALGLVDDEAHRARALELLDGDDPEGAPSRIAFAEQLIPNLRERPALPTLAGAAARSLVRDHAAAPPEVVRPLLRRLLGAASDPLLRADVPPLPVTQPARAELVHTLPGDLAGNAEIRDARVLPDGKLLVALGEPGVLLATRDGRRIAHFTEPAHHLVLSDRGHRVITVAERGAQRRLGRIDLVRRRAGFWADLTLAAHAPDFDGWTWFVSDERGELLALDATAKTVRHDLRSADGMTWVIRRDAARLALLRQVDDGLELWRYELRPQLTLRGREPIPARGTVGFAPSGATTILERLPDRLRLLTPGGASLERPVGEEGASSTFTSSETHAILMLPCARGWVAECYEHRGAARVAQVLFEGACALQAVAGAGEVTLFDDRGRIARLDLERRRVTHATAIRV